MPRPTKAISDEVSTNTLLIVVPGERVYLKAITQTSISHRAGHPDTSESELNLIWVGEGLRLLWYYQNHSRHCRLIILRPSKRASSIHSLSNSPCDSKRRAAG